MQMYGNFVRDFPHDGYIFWVGNLWAPWKAGRLGTTWMSGSLEVEVIGSKVSDRISGFVTYNLLIKWDISK